MRDPRVGFALEIAAHDTDSSVDGIACWTWRVGFLDNRVLLLSSEGRCWAVLGDRLVVARTGLLVGIRVSEVGSEGGSKNMADVLAPLRGLVDLHAANTWHVSMVPPFGKLVAKVELGCFPGFIIGVGGIPEFEVTLEAIGAGAWWTLVFDLDFAIIFTYRQVRLADALIFIPALKCHSISRTGAEVCLFFPIFQSNNIHAPLLFL